MYINPQVAISSGWIKGNITSKHIQPNAIDFTLDRLMKVSYEDRPAFVGEGSKKMSPLVEVHPWNKGDGTKYWTLINGEVYDGTSDFYVELPSGIAALLYTRSTLARNGVFIVSGLYDSGYKGQIGFTMYPLAHPLELEVGVRVGQIAFVSSESVGLYAGGWNHEQGTHYADQKAIDLLKE